jgi:hypothetical protein
MNQYVSASINNIVEYDIYKVFFNFLSFLIHNVTNFRKMFIRNRQRLIFLS